jgi:hypothetical protein
MKSLKHLVVVSIFAALACSGLHAQSVDLRATIPFDFHAGKTLLPAGDYLIHGDGPVVWLRAEDHSKPAFALMTIAAVAGMDQQARSRPARVEFNRYGDEFFLRTIWNPSTAGGRQLVPTAREKELVAHGNVPARTAVAVYSTK